MFSQANTRVLARAMTCLRKPAKVLAPAEPPSTAVVVPVARQAVSASIEIEHHGVVDVHVEIDQAGRDESSAGIDDAPGARGRDAGGDKGDPAGADRDVAHRRQTAGRGR